MQINSVGNVHFATPKQNFKGSSAVSSPIQSTPSAQSVPLETSKSYASPQITQGYKELETFDVPYVGKGKLYELANGHKVVLIPKVAPTLIYTSVGVGNYNEPAATKETSHLLEHLLGNYCFKPKDKEAEAILNKTGAETNAQTSDTATSYYIKAPINDEDDFEKLIRVQSETLKNTKFTPEEVENEKDIIIQELSAKGGFTSDLLLANRLGLKDSFNLKESDPMLVPYSVSTVKNIKKEDLINYYNTFYQPKNMITTIIGSVDDNSIKTIAKYLGKTQTPPLILNQTEYPELSIDNPIQKTIRRDVRSLDKNGELAHIMLSFVGPNNNDEKDMLVSYALREAFRAKIDENDKYLDCIISSDTLSLKKGVPDLIRIFALESNSDVEDTLKTIYSIVYDLAQKPISNKELQVVKNQMRDRASSASENSFLTAVMKSEEVGLSKKFSAKTEEKFIDSLTAQDIQYIAKKYLDLNKASLVVVHPQEKPKVSPFDKVKSANRPSFTGNVDQLSTKDIHEYLLPNNLRVVIDSRPGVTRSTVNFDLHSTKTLYNNPEASVHLAYSLISKEHKKMLDDKAITFEYDADSQQIYSKFSGSPDKTLEMIDYATGTLLYPDFSRKQFDKVKKVFMEDESSAEPEPKTIGSLVNDEMLKGSPYKYVEGGLKDLQFEDTISLHRQILKNAQGTVYITIPQEKLKDIQPKIFQKLMSIPKMRPHDYNAIFNKYKPQPLEKTKVFTRIDDEKQIKVDKVFKLVESGNIKDRAGLLLLNDILGGGDKSRLFKYLRNDDRLAYSVHSDFNTYIDTGNLSRIILSTTVSSDNKDNLQTVVKEYDKSINELISKPVTKEELDDAKNRLKSDMLIHMETSFSRNSYVSDHYNSFYGAGYQKALLEAFDNMTPEYVQALAKYYFTQPYMLAVAADKETLEVNKEYLKKFGEITECKS